MTYFIILLATVPSGSIQGTVPRFTTGKDTKAQHTQNASRFSLSVVAKAANDDRQLDSQAFRQVIKHILSSELEDVLNYLSVACVRLRALSIIVFALARYHSYSTVAGGFGV